MTLALRTLAVVIAIAGVVDPMLARPVPAPLAVEIRLPRPSDPGFASADALRRELVAALRREIEIDGARAPQAVVAIGDAAIDGAPAVPVFFVPLDDGRPAITIQRFDTPGWTPPGRAVHVRSTVRGTGLAKRRTALSVRLRGVTLARTLHEWTSDDESFEAAFTFAPPSTGAHRVRLVAETDGLRESVADTLIRVRDQPLRVLVYDARPTWPAAFVRRSLSADATFAVAATSRSSRPAATIAGGAPPRLDALNPDRYDAIVVGALDDLRPEDLRALDRFARGRGGTVVLVPDRRIPAAVTRAFDLPEAQEVLLERPVEVRDAAAPVRASEILLLVTDDRATTVATVPYGGGRPVVAAFHRGEGLVVVSGLLDAWRFRADANGAFDTFWRSLVADAALAARPPAELRISPAAARPGDIVNLALQVRPGEFQEAGQLVTVGTVRAELTGTDGTSEIIRLWPGARAGLFEATLSAPAPGGYTVRATHGQSSVEVPLLAAADVVQVAADARAALAHTAALSGGAVAASAAEAARALESVQAGTIQRTARPMRSPWWIVPFAALLCAEWAIRRRVGMK